MEGLQIDYDRLADLCRAYGVARLDLFGSVVRGEAEPDSDVDLLYTLLPGASLGWEIVDLSDALAEILGRPVDLVSRRALNAALRSAVLAEAEVLYAAA